MKYLKLFQTLEEYDAYMAGEVFYPNVSYVQGTKSVFYNTEVPLYILAIEDLTITMSLMSSDGVAYSLDGVEWVALTTKSNKTPVIPAGSKVYFKNSTPASNAYRESAMFTISAPCKLGGNIMSMLYGDDYSGKTDTQAGCFRGMFRQQTSIQDASSLVMPATSMTSQCYREMFLGCSSMVKGPALPALILVDRCYEQMFYGCSSLQYIKALFTTTPSSSYTNSWVSGVASSGVFVKNKDAAWSVTGNNGVPSSWTIETA